MTILQKPGSEKENSWKEMNTTSAGSRSQLAIKLVREVLKKTEKQLSIKKFLS